MYLQLTYCMLEIQLLVVFVFLIVETWISAWRMMPAGANIVELIRVILDCCRVATSAVHFPNCPLLQPLLRCLTEAFLPQLLFPRASIASAADATGAGAHKANSCCRECTTALVNFALLPWTHSCNLTLTQGLISRRPLEGPGCLSLYHRNSVAVSSAASVHVSPGRLWTHLVIARAAPATLARYRDQINQTATVIELLDLGLASLFSSVPLRFVLLHLS